MAFQQNLAGAAGGAIQGAHGGTQQLGAAALRRLGGGAPAGPNMAGGGLNPGATPPIMDPAQKPGGPPPQPGGIQAKPMALPGFQPMPSAPGDAGPLQMFDGGAHAFGPGAPGGSPEVDQITDLPGGGKPVQWGTAGQGLEAPGGGPDQVGMDANTAMGVRQMGGTPPPDAQKGPLPGFTAAPGQIGGQMTGKPFGGDQRPMGALPGPNIKFPPQKPGGTKPLSLGESPGIVPTGRHPLAGGGAGGGGGVNTGQYGPKDPRNNRMQGF